MYQSNQDSRGDMKNATLNLGLYNRRKEPGRKKDKS